METISYTTARKNLAKVMDEVCQDHAPITIAKKGQDSVVLISLEDYSSMKETWYLLSSPRNAKRL